uniref:LUD domain-containing protein n=1 Tax=Clostridium sp. NkU-1 TaxID=1095009 RepID=UPI0006CFD28D
MDLYSQKNRQDIPLLIKHLQRNNMAGYLVQDKNELLELLRKLIADGTTVGCGDSVTLEQTGVFEDLRNRDVDFPDKFDPSLTREEKRKIYLRNFSADTFITGANAITMDGKIFNIDGNGSRVAPMLYGPEQVIVVAGANKITKDVEAAIKRTRQIAAPLDAKRLNKSTPCTSLGRCIDCGHRERICNDFVLIAGQFVKDRIKVIIVDEELGY